MTSNFFTELYYLRLPKDIKDYRVILMDATVATGAAAMMAIRVLLDHDVKEENINLVTAPKSVLSCHSKICRKLQLRQSRNILVHFVSASQ